MALCFPVEAIFGWVGLGYYIIAEHCPRSESLISESINKEVKHPA